MVRTPYESVLPANSVQIGALEGGDFLSNGFREPKGMDYRNAPIDIFRTPEGEADRFDAVIRHPGMNPLQFVGFLRRVAPNKLSTSALGIAADYLLADERSDSRDMVRLRARHASLGPEWSEIMASQPAIQRTMMQAIEPANGAHRQGVFTEFVQPHIAWRRKVDSKREFLFERLTAPVPDRKTDVVHIDGVAGVLAVAYFAPNVRKQWPTKKKIGSKGREQFMGPAQVPLLALLEAQGLLASRFIRTAESLGEE